jgi:hypothetical protein
LSFFISASLRRATASRPGKTHKSYRFVALFHQISTVSHSAKKQWAAILRIYFSCSEIKARGWIKNATAQVPHGHSILDNPELTVQSLKMRNKAMISDELIDRMLSVLEREILPLTRQSIPLK